MNALVIGASGHIGNAVVRELLGQRCKITATSRRKEPPANLRGLPVRYARGDSDVPGQFDNWVAGHEIVVDGAAPYALHLRGTRLAEKDPLKYAACRTHALLNAVRRHDARLIYISSFTTLVRPHAGLDGWPALIMRGLHPYFAVKDLIESMLIAAAREGTRIVIVNPTICLGPWDLKSREFCFVPRLVAGEIPAIPHHVLNVMIDVRDVAAAAVGALNAKHYGEPILLHGHNISTEELFAWICEIAGTATPSHRFPLSFLALSAYTAEALLGLAGLRTPLPSLVPILISQQERITSGRASELRIPVRPLSETLNDAIDWYRALGYC